MSTGHCRKTSNCCSYSNERQQAGAADGSTLLQTGFSRASPIRAVCPCRRNIFDCFHCRRGKDRCGLDSVPRAVSSQPLCARGQWSPTKTNACTGLPRLGAAIGRAVIRSVLVPSVEMQSPIHLHGLPGDISVRCHHHHRGGDFLARTQATNGNSSPFSERCGAIISVSINEGATAFTVTPSFAKRAA